MEAPVVSHVPTGIEGLESKLLVVQQSLGLCCWRFGFGGLGDESEMSRIRAVHLVR